MEHVDNSYSYLTPKYNPQKEREREKAKERASEKERYVYKNTQKYIYRDSSRT